MKNARLLSVLGAAVAALAIVGCGDTTATVPTLFNDSTATLDIAASAGDAAATAVATMMANEDAANAPTSDLVGSGLVLDIGHNPTAALFAITPNLTTTRTRTCFDATGAVVAGCTPIASVRKIATHVTVDGTRSSNSSTTGGTAATWTGSVHRVSNDTATRVFSTATPPVETSRVHSDLGTDHDTTVFTDATMTRTNAEAAHDSVKAVTFTLPRSSNPFPVSGMIVRVDSVHVSITKASQSETKDVVRTVEVDFPADNQGNVVLKVNAKTCNLNLVTHVVSACH